MYVNVTVRPEEFQDDASIKFRSEAFKSYTGVYVGAHTYIWDMQVDNGIEFEVGNGSLFHNVQIGRFNSIAHGLKIHVGRNHNIKRVHTGALELFLENKGISQKNMATSFNQKGSVIIQNDVWIGGDVTIVPNVIIRNGAVIARNSHVASDVPPYAIVGGNPAKIIGYRYPQELIKKLQIIQWWYWDHDKLLANAEYFTEDVVGFCDKFFLEANRQYELDLESKTIENDRYFAFVDWYEAYSSYPFILKQFLSTYADREDKKLTLFILEDVKSGHIEEELFLKTKGIIENINDSAEYSCKVELCRGGVDEAKSVFCNCTHYIIARTYHAVMFSCMADLYNMKIISGVDSNIPFENQRNMYKMD